MRIRLNFFFSHISSFLQAIKIRYQKIEWEQYKQRSEHTKNRSTEANRNKRESKHVEMKSETHLSANECSTTYFWYFDMAKTNECDNERKRKK